MSKSGWKRTRSAASLVLAGAVSFSIVGAGIAYASSNGSDHGETVAELGIGDIPIIRSAADIRLPIDAYHVPADVQNLVLHAEHEAMIACMARFGLDWDAPVIEVEAGGPSHDRLFGVTDLDEVKQYGYHAPSLGALNADGSTSDPVKDANSYDYTDEQDAVASGSTELAEVNGVKIPAGGCITEARSRVGTQEGLVVELTEATIGYGAMQADKDPRVLKGFDQWSKCMADSGYPYSTPWEANDDPAWGTFEATAEEIAVAVTDVQCQQKSNLSGLRVAVAAAWQREYMQAHKEDFAMMKKSIAQQRVNAASILVSGN